MSNDTSVAKAELDPNDDYEVLEVVYNEGERLPWEIRFNDVSHLKTMRAILNYPAHKFESEEKAVEVATMLRDIIKADAVAVEGETELLDDTEKAPFFKQIVSDDDDSTPMPDAEK
jgi:hypothetical protein